MYAGGDTPNKASSFLVGETRSHKSVTGRLLAHLRQHGLTLSLPPKHKRPPVQLVGGRKQESSEVTYRWLSLFPTIYVLVYTDVDSDVCMDGLAFTLSCCFFFEKTKKTKKGGKTTQHIVTDRCPSSPSSISAINSLSCFVAEKNAHLSHLLAVSP